MASHDEELVAAAKQLLVRRAGQRGRLAGAKVRRSISTAYYAIFHFVVQEATRSLVGTRSDLRRRRRILARKFNHEGMRVALEKVRSEAIHESVSEFLRPPGQAAGTVQSPAFARVLARAFSDAQATRHDADYDLNKALSELDAHRLIVRVERAIETWRAATTPGDKDFKQAISLLLLLGGRLRPDRG
jgi:uncharacterized protein (UPF0332 family)